MLSPDLSLLLSILQTLPPPRPAAPARSLFIGHRDLARGAQQGPEGVASKTSGSWGAQRGRAEGGSPPTVTSCCSPQPRQESLSLRLGFGGVCASTGTVLVGQDAIGETEAQRRLTGVFVPSSLALLPNTLHPPASLQGRPLLPGPCLSCSLPKGSSHFTGRGGGGALLRVLGTVDRGLPTRGPGFSVHTQAGPPFLLLSPA